MTYVQTILFGADETQGIVAVEAGESKAVVYVREEGKITEVCEPFTAWLQLLHILSSSLSSPNLVTYRIILFPHPTADEPRQTYRAHSQRQETARLGGNGRPHPVARPGIKYDLYQKGLSLKYVTTVWVFNRP